MPMAKNNSYDCERRTEDPELGMSGVEDTY